MGGAERLQSCPVCGSDVANPDERDYGDKKRIDCPRCGPYEASRTALAILPARLDGDEIKVARLSHSIRQEVADDQGFMLSSRNLDTLLDRALPTIGEQKKILVSLVAQTLGEDQLGSAALPSLLALTAIVGTVDESRAQRLIDLAISDGLIERDFSDVDRFSVTDRGWKLVGAIASNRRSNSMVSRAVDDSGTSADDLEFSSFGTHQRAPINFHARCTLWNEIRSRGNPQMIVQAVTVPRWRRTDEQIDLEVLIAWLGWQSTAKHSHSSSSAAEMAFGMFENWKSEFETEAPSSVNEFYKRIMNEKWVSLHRNPIDTKSLLEIFNNSQIIIQSAPNLALAVLIVGGAIVILNFAWHASGPIGSGVGQRIKSAIERKNDIQDMVNRIEEFTEDEDDERKNQ